MRHRACVLAAVALGLLPACDRFSGPTKSVSITVISSDVPKEVPADPASPARSALTVSGLPGDLSDVQVSVNVAGAPICSLSLSIRHPDGTNIVLLRAGQVPTTFQCSDNFTTLSTVFPTRTPTPGAPDLSTLDGKRAEGTWTLVATDGREEPDDRRFTVSAWMMALTVQQ